MTTKPKFPPPSPMIRKLAKLGIQQVSLFRLPSGVCYETVEEAIKDVEQANRLEELTDLVAMTFGDNRIHPTYVADWIVERWSKLEKIMNPTTEENDDDLPL